MLVYSIRFVASSSMAALRFLLILLPSLEAAGRTTELAFGYQNGGSSTQLTHPTGTRRQRPTALPQLHIMMPSTYWLAAVEVFDGSDIVDPVVVSNVFWTSMQTRIVSLVIGQILAAVVFSVLLAVVASQSGKVTTFLSDKIFANQPSSGIKIPPEMRKSGAIVQPDYLKLLACIMVDTVGASSELVPILGEATDVIWAPIAGLLLRQLYGGNNNLLLGLEFAEEMLPFTDILPLCTLCWVIDTYFADSKIAQLLQLGQYGRTTALKSSSIKSLDPDVIDVDQITDDINDPSRR